MTTSSTPRAHEWPNVDVDALLGAAIDAASRNDVGVNVECLGIGDDAALVSGHRENLERAFERILSAAVRSTRRGAAVRVTLSLDADAISTRVEHPLRLDSDAAVDADAGLQLALARAMVEAHRGSFRIAVDPIRHVRVILAVLPRAATDA